MTWKRHVLVFTATFGGIFVALVAIIGSDHRFRGVNADFRSLAHNEYINVTGLTRKEKQQLKVAFIRNHEPPKVGVLGNHVIQYMSASAFGARSDSNFFFNYWYANIGLPELMHYLLYLEKIGKLPSDLIIVQITTPNNDMGNHIVKFGGELHESLVNYSEIFSDLLSERFAESLGWMFTYGVVEPVEQTFDYSAIYGELYRLFKGFDMGQEEFDRRRLRSPDHCLLDYQNDPPADCVAIRSLSSSFRADGSISRNFREYTVPLALNGDSGGMVQNLFPKDIPRIVLYMSEINDIAARNGAELVFLIPPLYEEPRRTVVDEIFDEALAQLPSTAYVVDHRGKFRDPKFFYIYDHPSNLYYSKLADELTSLFPNVLGRAE